MEEKRTEARNMKLLSPQKTSTFIEHAFSSRLKRKGREKQTKRKNKKNVKKMKNTVQKIERADFWNKNTLLQLEREKKRLQVFSKTVGILSQSLVLYGRLLSITGA